MATIIFSIGNNTCNLLSDHHFKSYLETTNHRKRERKRETERQRGRERERQRETKRQRETARDRERNHSKQFLQTTTG